MRMSSGTMLCRDEPLQNAFAENLFGRRREGSLCETRFSSFDDASTVLTAWRKNDNCVRHEGRAAE